MTRGRRCDNHVPPQRRLPKAWHTPRLRYKSYSLQHGLLFFFQIFGEDAGGALYLGGTGTALVVFGRAGRGPVVAAGRGALEAKEVGTDDGAVLLFKTVEEVLHDLVALALALPVGTVGLAAVHSGEYDHSAHGAAHHAQAPHAAAEAGSYLEGLRGGVAVKVAEGGHDALAAAVALHEIIYCALDALFEFGIHRE